MTQALLIRDARDDDALDVIELIGSVFGEYTGCVLDVDGEMPELRRIASTFRDLGGAFWVAEREGRIVGMVGYGGTPAVKPVTGDAGTPVRRVTGDGGTPAVRPVTGDGGTPAVRPVTGDGGTPAVRPVTGGGIELKKLYVHRRERKTGLGRALVDRVEAAARARGAAFVDLWSDTRFTTAHAFYERRGYERGPTTRDLGDLSKSVEFYFKKTLA